MYIKIDESYRGLSKREYWSLHKYCWVYSSRYNEGASRYKDVSDKYLKEIKRKQ